MSSLELFKLMQLQEHLTTSYKKDLQEALKNDPKGEFCNKCGDKNDLVDELGWFYNQIEDKGYLPVCKKCNTVHGER